MNKFNLVTIGPDWHIRDLFALQRWFALLKIPRASDDEKGISSDWSCIVILKRKKAINGLTLR